MKKLYKFYQDLVYGELEGLFIAEEKEVKNAIGKNMYFGEILGKHSEIYGKLEKYEIAEISEDQKLIQKLEKIFNDQEALCGYNPLDYIQE